MRLSNLAIFLFSSFHLSSAALLAIRPRAGGPGDAQVTCDFYKQREGIYNGGTSDGCILLVDDCVNKMNATQSSDPWSESTCVAAATCTGTATLVIRVECTHLDKPMRSEDTPPLSLNVYKSILGSDPCVPETPQDCPMTQEDYVDYIRKSLSQVGGQEPNMSQILDEWWEPIRKWAADAGEDDDTVSYKSFDNWLHLSHSQ